VGAPAIAELESKLLQEVVAHVLDVEDPDVGVLVHARSHVSHKILFILAELLLGLVFAEVHFEKGR